LKNIQGVIEKIDLISGDLRKQEEINKIVAKYTPEYIFNLASPSSPFASWQNPILVSDITALGPGRILEAIRKHSPDSHFYQASSSEIFGEADEQPQNEKTPFKPRNPYGIAKLFAHWMTARYRDNYGLHSVSGIQYNHESPRRGLDFVTRKITRAAAKIKLGLVDELRLGNLEARRDWGHARDYVEAMWLMVNAEIADDFVIGTGITHSVREFCEAAFTHLDLNYEEFVVVDPEFFRPSNNTQLVADASKARQQLEWLPCISFIELVEEMVLSDLKDLSDSI
jgi:GDPmannose 4,6-dehydratase